MSEAKSNASSRQPSTERSGTSTPTSSTTPPTAAMDNKTPDESSKLRTFLGILKKFIGVSDMASQRFSLPAQLMEPVPNLEYWHYLDRPETFASIGDSDDPLGRMLGALRFWFTKDLKYVKGKPCKPYNSVLGEFFRCNWDIEETLPPLLGSKPHPSSSSPQNTGGESRDVRVTYLTEQTSHHPPVSAYYIECPEKNISARGFDQIAANFTGTRIRVQPGVYNHGIYITLHNFDETYHLTHPIAHLGGLLKGSLSVSVADTCTISCPQTKLKALLTYLEDGWVSRAQNKVMGVIFKYDTDNEDKYTRIKDVPDSEVLARIEGSWQDQIYFTLGPKAFDKVDTKEKTQIVDLSPLFPAAKSIPPMTEQLTNESRKFWDSVTVAINNKQWSQATSAKQEIEERQRQKVAERKARNVEWAPRFFKEALTPPGRPELSEEGREAVRKLHVGDFGLAESKETGA